MVSGTSRTAPITLLALFVLLAGLPVLALGWLGWRLLEQDRALEAQRTRERLDNAASLAVRELDRGLSGWSDLLLQLVPGEAARLPHGATFLRFDSHGVVQRQGVRLPYYPRVVVSSEVPATQFTDAEAAEFRDGDLTQAARLYRGSTNSPDEHVRAAALLRLARVLRKQQRHEQALVAYDELAQLGETPVAGTPAELVARRERAVLLQSMGDDDAAHEEARLLASTLWEGRFAVDRSTFEFYGESMLAPPDTAVGASASMALARAVEGLWPLWQEESAGRSAWTEETAAFGAVWRSTPAGTVAMVAPVDALMAAAATVVDDLDVFLALEDPGGRPSWGTPRDDRVSVGKSFRETGLPWTLHVTLANPAVMDALWVSRRNVFAGGFGLMLLVIATAGYFVFGAVHRELGVARLQSDFVAAVSHEFRTPLTAMCHLTELLEDGAAPPERVPDYHRALGKESRRLHAMVEKLLDFGRVDAGRRDYEFSETDVAALVDQVVQDCRDHSRSATHRLDWQVPTEGREPLLIQADRESLKLALRNLVDNALKYSAEASTVRIVVERLGAWVGIAVEDEGVGIARNERRTIFQKFARGSAARTLNVKGTGIGLAMAAQIVKAHGGRLELVSEPGRGTRFTALIPVQTSGA